MAVAIIAALVLAQHSRWANYKPSSSPMPTATTAGTPLPACRSDQYHLDAGVIGETTAGLGIQIRPAFVEGSACTLTAQAELSALDGAGILLPVTGNPVTATISGLVGPGIDETMAFPNQFFWSSNWCGPSLTPPRLQVRVAGQVVMTMTSGFPICISQGGESSLTVIGSQE